MRMIKINFWSDYKSKARTQKINLYHHHSAYMCVHMDLFFLLAANDQALQLIFLLFYRSLNLTAPNNLAFLIANAKINWGDYNASAITFHLTSLSFFSPLCYFIVVVVVVVGLYNYYMTWYLCGGQNIISAIITRCNLKSSGWFFLIAKIHFFFIAINFEILLSKFIIKIMCMHLIYMISSLFKMSPN